MDEYKEILQLIQNDILQVKNYFSYGKSDYKSLSCLNKLIQANDKIKAKIYYHIISNICKFKDEYILKDRNMIITIINFYSIIVKRGIGDKLIEELNLLPPTFLTDTNYVLIKNIGKGLSSEVFLALDLLSLNLYAIKHIKYNKISKQLLSYIQDEIEIISSIDNEYIVGLKEILYKYNNGEKIIIDSNLKKIPYGTEDIYMILEYGNYGDYLSFSRYYTFLKKNSIPMDKSTGLLMIENHIDIYLIKEENMFNSLPLYGIHKFIKCIISALTYLDEKLILHRDIKPSNILVFEDPEDHLFPFKFKLCDFTMAKRMEISHQLLESRCGTPAFMSPERIDGGTYNQTSDMWSLGATFSIVFFGFLPFKIEKMSEITKKDIDKFIDNQLIKFEYKCKLLPEPIIKFYIHHLKKTLKSLLAVDQTERLTLKDYKESIFNRMDILSLLSDDYEKKFKSLVKIMSIIMNENDITMNTTSLFTNTNSNAERSITHLKKMNKTLLNKIDQLENQISEYKSDNELLRSIVYKVKNEDLLY